VGNDSFHKTSKADRLLAAFSWRGLPVAADALQNSGSTSRVARGLEQCARILLRVAGAKNGISGNEKIRSCFDDQCDGVVSDATVYFNPITQTQFLAKFFEALDLLEGVGDETLAAETGIYAHNKNVMHHSQHWDEQVDRSGGVDDYSGLHSMVGDETESAVQVAAGLVMHAHPVGASLGKRLDEFVGIVDHHVAVEGQMGDAAQGLDYRWAQSEVGHKVTVHHVDMNDGSPASLSGAHLFAKSCEVGGKNGWK
jgi:hypothetical protein